MPTETKVQFEVQCWYLRKQRFVDIGHRTPALAKRRIHEMMEADALQGVSGVTYKLYKLTTVETREEIPI